MKTVTVISVFTEIIVGLDVIKVMQVLITISIFTNPVWVMVVGGEAIQYAILGIVPVHHPIVQLKFLRHHVYHIIS